MARKRLEHEEARVNECQQNIQRVRERQASLASVVAEVDTESEHESVSSVQGMQALANMNSELEALIRSVYAKIQAEQRTTAPQATVAVSQ